MIHCNVSVRLEVSWLAKKAGGLMTNPQDEISVFYTMISTHFFFFFLLLRLRQRHGEDAAL